MFRIFWTNKICLYVQTRPIKRRPEYENLYLTSKISKKNEASASRASANSKDLCKKLRMFQVLFSTALNSFDTRNTTPCNTSIASGIISAWKKVVHIFSYTHFANLYVQTPHISGHSDTFNTKSMFAYVPTHIIIMIYLLPTASVPFQRQTIDCDSGTSARRFWQLLEGWCQIAQ